MCDVIKLIRTSNVENSPSWMAILNSYEVEQ